MLTIVVAPYLVSCAIATGDPLLAINYHTSYYRFAEAQPIDTPMSAAEYLRGKFVDRPIRTLDTGLNGLFVQPFITKWHGFNEWMSGFGSLVRAISVVGLAALPFFPPDDWCWSRSSDRSCPTSSRGTSAAAARGASPCTPTRSSSSRSASPSWARGGRCRPSREIPRS